MKRFCLFALMMGVAIGAAGRAHAVTFTVNPADPWLGYMNVFDLPANGGAYKFGSPWGTVDLTATFAGPVLTMGPNTIGDTSDYWYQGAPMSNPGGPGVPGNKIMDANMYIEFGPGVHGGENVVFTGTVTANTLVAPYTAVAFIKDFAPDYSSSVATTIPLTPGVFNISLDTIADPLRHVQYGFTINGPNVWVTDVAPLGTVKVTAFPAPTPVPGDFNGNGTVDGADLGIWKTAYGQTGAADANGDGVSDGKDFLIWQTNAVASGVPVGAAVPEPTCAVLAVAGLGLLAASRRKRAE